MSYSDLTGETWDMTPRLTYDEAEVIAHALKQVFLFDGVHQPTDDQNLACDILVKLGFGDPREGDSE